MHSTRKSLIGVAVPPIMTAFLLAACGNLSEMSCDDIVDSAIQVSNGTLVKIYDQTLVSKSENDITCKGTGLFNNASRYALTFRAYRDKDGDLIVSYDASKAMNEAVEYQNAEALRKFEAEQRVEEQKIQRQIEIETKKLEQLYQN